MDNLPVDAVVKFLWKAQEKRLVKLWSSAAPHLIFTASLQARQPVLKPKQVQEAVGSWQALQKRQGV